MNLSQAAQKRLLEWCGLETWHKNHQLDMRPWYAFVDQYQRDHEYWADDTSLRAHIEEKIEANGCQMNDHLRKVIADRVSLMNDILDFLKHTGR